MLRANLRWALLMLVVAGGLMLVAATASAAPPWATLVPFKKVEADPDKAYELDEKHGPWIIMAASFAGASAEQQAQDLVLELRQKFKLEAYTFRQAFDFTKPTEGNGLSKDGSPRRMRYLYNTKFEEIAVVVGHFQSPEDPQLEKTLERIKYARPAVFQREENKSTQRMGSLRDVYRAIVNDPSRKSKGPMGAAFATRNPLVPEGFFTSQGLDPFVAEMNRDLPHSLLKCPGRYTVRVATFRGVDTMKPAEFERLTKQERKYSKIDEAALKASELCKLLRQQGVEAYEFHDRTESIVTVGSFQEVGQPRIDGKTEINPAIHRIMETFGPIKQQKPGTNMEEVYARVLNGLRFDPQPIPVQVPKQSIAATYDPANSPYR
jgi:hypothetical protein